MIIDKGKCLPCGVCVAVCENFSLMIIDNSVEQIAPCNGCRRCVVKCPLGAIKLVEK